MHQQPRIEDLRERSRRSSKGGKADGVARDGRVRRRVRLEAEAEGLDKVFEEFGAEWRFAGCSMCLGMNPDQLAPGERCASTTNRNFEGRQGKGGRTHLVSPLVRRRRPLSGARCRAPAPRATSAERASARGGGLMDKFTTHTGIAAPLKRSAVDTDQIIPARVPEAGDQDGVRGRALRELAAGPRTSSSISPSTRARASSSRGRTSARAPAASTRCGRCATSGSRSSSAPSSPTSSAGNAGKQGLLTGVISEVPISRRSGPRSRRSRASR